MLNCLSHDCHQMIAFYWIRYAPPTQTTDRVCGTTPNGFWQLLPQSGSGGSQTFTAEVSYGTTFTLSYSNSSSSSSSWGKTASNQVAQGFSVSGGGGFSFFGIGASASVGSSSTQTTTHSVSSAYTTAVSSMFTSDFARTETVTEEHAFSGDNIQALWQFSWNFTAVFPTALAGTNIVATNNFAATQNDDMVPCCLPGHFADTLTPGTSSCVPLADDGIVFGPSPIMCSSDLGSSGSTSVAKGAGAAVPTAIAVVLVFVLGAGAFYAYRKSRAHSSAKILTNLSHTDMYEDEHDDDFL